MNGRIRANNLLTRFNGSTTFNEVYLGGDTNAVHIAPGGDLTLLGTATVWDDVRVSVDNVRLGSSRQPTPTAYRGGLVLAFSKQTQAVNEEIVYFSVQLPHRRKDGSTLYPHVHWTTSNNNAGVVRWKITYSWANIGAAFPVETPDTAQDANPGQDVHIYSEFTPIVGTGKTASSMLICSLSRNSSNAADTYASAAYLLEIDFHYEIDKMGETNLP